MRHSQTGVWLCCIALFGLRACKPANNTGESLSKDTHPPSAAVREPTAIEKTAAENAKRIRAQELTSLISTAQAQREDVVQAKSNLEVQLTAYQADSTAKLDQLKKEMQALERQKSKSTATSDSQRIAKQMNVFSERARNELEHALAMDQEYQAQLKQANDELGNLDEGIAAMRAEEESLRLALQK